ncbi:MAG: DUF2442 domain-containing protein [Candidatus Scalindua sp. AMX11]|nr:MAG: DUF2442 domain-containing protein [Candidatus Scalindua sp.]NOG82974.1 DUF2442 domain-containing protein [Planctomycetota bacterium]RZV68052.1 MAG: DUF2442 domain-containing protein [Candidatus Scalindua sp. SCAELEC01]TDE63744.1 MAG: DUF2442 domain-containing protein [Candidatus Scalindua sp. AMX11]GJQ60473.1 MAG: hypothetical protein SCALA701_32740 [Candidatus Scalindua sp.]
MSTLVLEHECLAQKVVFGKNSFTVYLNDGRNISVPIIWYPRLINGSKIEQENYELIGDGEGIHWPDIDEDISIEGILAGRRSGESQNSLDKWLKERKQKIKR